MKDKLRNTLYLANLLSALFIVVLSVFHYNKVHNITLYIFFITYFIEIFVDKRWKNIRFDRYIWIFGTMIFIYLCTLLWMPFETHRDYTTKILEYRLPFISFGIIGILGLNKYHKFKTYAYVLLIYSSLIIAYLWIFKIDYNILRIHENPTEYFSSLRTAIFTSHHYFDYLLNIAIIGGFYILYTSNNIKYKWWLRILVCLAILAITATMPLSDGRSGLLATFGIVVFSICYLLWQKSKWIASFIAILALFGATGLYMQHPKIANKNIEQDTRIIFWKHAINTINDGPITGYGAGDASSIYMDTLQQNLNEQWATPYDPVFTNLQKRRIICVHCHNQVLQSTMEFGIIGGISIIILLIAPIFITLGRKVWIAATTFSLVNSIQLLTDIFVGGLPLITFAIIICIILNEDKCRLS